MQERGASTEGSREPIQAAAVVLDEDGTVHETIPMAGLGQPASTGDRRSSGTAEEQAAEPGQAESSDSDRNVTSQADAVGSSDTAGKATRRSGQTHAPGQDPGSFEDSDVRDLFSESEATELKDEIHRAIQTNTIRSVSVGPGTEQLTGSHGGLIVPLRVLDGSARVLFVDDPPIETADEYPDRYFEQAQSLADIGSWYYDIETGELEWSEKVYRIFGIPPGTAVTYEDFIDTVHPEDRERVEERWEAAKDGVPYEVEHRIVSDGLTKWVRQAADVEYSPDGEPVAGIGVVQDITEQKVREHHLQVTDRLLRHNLRNDLTVIQGYATTIADDCEGHPAEMAARIRETSNRLLQMGKKARVINEVIGKEVGSVAIDLVDCLDTITEEMETSHPDATIRIRADGAPIALANPRLEMAVSELIRNAIIYSDRDSPTVSITLCEEEGGVEIEIADDGPGIPKIERTIVTHNETIDPVHHGSGLGLWMVHWIVRRSDGRLEFAENDPRGSVVTISLPAA